ncbi:hypothetical protein TR75_02430 [Hydrogenibacillus schlegelii]|uniref:Uncharacterized protein n=1 Tax=Hydrogenibacillus schlegelii TaxID=1484 RepID=A0A132NBV8_HYDSH|nr:hypothetical protein TR75_02430 [Hydrogenibacillus schlegelii]OAR03981.1 hypothetical protein SA87_00965 [Hydrogenibacillus schlegelii]
MPRFLKATVRRVKSSFLVKLWVMRLNSLLVSWSWAKNSSSRATCLTPKDASQSATSPARLPAIHSLFSWEACIRSGLKKPRETLKLPFGKATVTATTFGFRSIPARARLLSGTGSGSLFRGKEMKQSNRSSFRTTRTV